MVTQANGYVFEFFGIDIQTIDRLTPTELVELRDEPETKQYTELLTSQTEKAVGELVNNQIPGTPTIQAISDARNWLKNRIVEKCNAELGRRRIESNTRTVLDVGGGLVLPGAALIRRGAISLGRAVAKTIKADWMNKSTTPLISFVELISKKTTGRVQKKSR